MTKTYKKILCNTIECLIHVTLLFSNIRGLESDYRGFFLQGIRDYLFVHKRYVMLKTKTYLSNSEGQTINRYCENFVGVKVKDCYFFSKKFHSVVDCRY